MESDTRVYPRFSELLGWEHRFRLWRYVSALDSFHDIFECWASHDIFTGESKVVDAMSLAFSIIEEVAHLGETGFAVDVRLPGISTNNKLTELAQPRDKGG